MDFMSLSAAAQKWDHVGVGMFAFPNIGINLAVWQIHIVNTMCCQKNPSACLSDSEDSGMFSSLAQVRWVCTHTQGPHCKYTQFTHSVDKHLSNNWLVCIKHQAWYLGPKEKSSSGNRNPVQQDNPSWSCDSFTYVFAQSFSIPQVLAVAGPALGRGEAAQVFAFVKPTF